MKKRNAAGMFLLVFFGMADTAVPAWGALGEKPYVLGTAVRPIPKRPLPKRGVAFVDPTFGTKITRLTDPSDGWGKKMRRHSYSTFSPFNCDGTRFTAQEFHWHLHDAQSGRHLKALQGPLGDSAAPRWDARNPHVFYFAEDTAFKQYDLQTDRVTVLHDFKKDFPRMKWLFQPAYGEPSADTRYWGFIVMAAKKERGEQIAKITYDREKDVILGKRPGHANGSYGRYIAISPSGKRVVIGEFIEGKRRSTSYRLDFSAPVPLEAKSGHADLGIDAEGRDVLVYGNDRTDHIAMQDLESGKETPLISYIHQTTWAELKKASGVGFHISGNGYGTPGWAVVSTYGYKKEKTLWNSHCIYLLKLDPKADPKKPVVWRVAHAHSIWDPKIGKHYWAETHASMDRYGRRIIFASNWDDPHAPIEDYCCDLPKGWYEILMDRSRARALRERVAKRLGMGYGELTGVSKKEVQ